jgi:acyl carrier protein
VDEIRSRLIRCFVALFPQVPEDQIPALTAASTKEWDSVAMATLLVLVEEEFGVSVQPEDLERMESFASLREYLSQRVTL